MPKTYVLHLTKQDDAESSSICFVRTFDIFLNKNWWDWAKAQISRGWHEWCLLKILDNSTVKSQHLINELKQMKVDVAEYPEACLCDAAICTKEAPQIIKDECWSFDCDDGNDDFNN